MLWSAWAVIAPSAPNVTNTYERIRRIPLTPSPPLPKVSQDRPGDSGHIKCAHWLGPRVFVFTYFCTPKYGLPSVCESLFWPHPEPPPTQKRNTTSPPFCHSVSTRSYSNPRNLT